MRDNSGSDTRGTTHQSTGGSDNQATRHHQNTTRSHHDATTGEQPAQASGWILTGMKILRQLVERLKCTRLYNIRGRQHVAIDKLEHLDMALELLKQDSDMLLKWIDTELEHVEFLSNKYRSEPDVHMYIDRAAMLERLRIHVEYFLSIK